MILDQVVRQRPLDQAAQLLDQVALQSDQRALDLVAQSCQHLAVPTLPVEEFSKQEIENFNFLRTSEMVVDY